MVKDSSRDGNLKKKRKSATAGDGETDGDVYKKCVEFEEKEALARPSELDAKLYFDTCKEIRQLFEEIGELKLKNKPEDQHKIVEKATEVSLRIVLLKKLNRMEKVRLVFPKEQLATEKQKVDSINLQYQNLLYEANHLNSEYRKCFQFKSKDEHIELVSVDEFLQKAPESLTQKFLKHEKVEGGEHELRLARLEWELQQRIHLADMCKKLEEEKKKLEGDIAERKSKLDKLGPLLSTVMEATKPVQEHLGLFIDKTQAEHKLASLLPNPLYLFYANADAYKQVNDKSMKVEIIGDQEEAAQWRELQLTNLIVEDDEESESDSQEVEEIVEVKKRRHRKSVQVDPMEEKKKKLLQVHPLAIEVVLVIKDGPSIKITLSFYPQLEIVTVSSLVNIPTSITGNAAREVLSNESVLVELVAGDFGLESPNPCTSYQLKKVGLGSFHSLVPDLGYVYGWAQKVCGIDFLARATCQKTADRLSQTNIELIMKTIKKRLRSRFILAKQLEELEKNVIPNLPSTMDAPKMTIASLSKWAPSTYQDFCQAKFTEALVEAEIISPSDIFYLATITRGSASLQAFIVIKNDYPSSPPIFSLCLNYNGVKHAQNDDNIRDMERSINVNWNNEVANANWLLSVQVNSLCVCLDIYLETDDPKSFQQNTMYIRSSCARNRRKPFKFRNIGVGVFTQ